MSPAKTPTVKRVLHIGMDGMNLPLLRRFAAEGVLPTFSALMARGSTNRILPAIPAWTPTNWATMATGAPAGTHGLAGWSVRQRTDPWSDHRLDSWHSDAMTAETIWEVADEAGLKVLVNFWPSGSWPSRLNHGYVVASGFHDSQFPIAAPVQFFCTSRTDVPEGRRGNVRRGGRSGSTVDTAETGIVPGSMVCHLRPAAESGWRNAPEGALGATLTVPKLRGGESQLYLLATRRGSGSVEHVSVCRDKDPASRLVTLTPGVWSDFAILHWGEGAGVNGNDEGSVRFHLLAASDGADPGGDVTLRVVSSQVYATRGFAAPDGLDRQLLEAAGPFFDTFSIGPTAGGAELQCFLDDIRYQGEWQVKVARHVMEHGGWDLHFSHWHLFDHINHPTVNPADPEGPNYDPARGAWMIDAQRQTYIVGDAVLKQFLELAGDETLVCIVSDHAMPPAHRWGHPAARLEETGLLVRRPDGSIDFARSKVYVLPDRGSEVYISLQGREPFGIVPPEQFEAVKDEILDALLDWRDPLNNKRIVALALKLEDAAVIGFWGDVCGDVVFTFNRGYGWGPPLEGGSAGTGRGAQHGSQIPTMETPYFTNMGAMIVAGPGIRPGYERDWQRHGLMRMVDFAPTVAHLTGLRPPRHNTGAILHDLWSE